MKEWLEVSDGYVQRIPDMSGSIEAVHVFDQSSVDAVNAALAARRPLLVRGEPGTGKSQLAIAAALALERPCLCQVVDNKTSAQDLLWTFDAVKRLAEAQLTGAFGAKEATAVRGRLAERQFVKPGPLWWALDWKSAQAQAELIGASAPSAPEGWRPEYGTVMLIDEIDKADTDVPNGLLEALGQGILRPRGFDHDIIIARKTPLVVVTTNEERALPDAFVRRCLVLHIELPSERNALEDMMVRRGQAHFPSAPISVLKEAAGQLVMDREEFRRLRLPPPGQAEYLDLIRATMSLRETEAEQLAILTTIAGFCLKKHVPEDQE